MLKLDTVEAIDNAELNDILQLCFVALDNAATHRKSPMHSPVVASVSTNNIPNQRVMVLREFDIKKNILRFHTDARSPKVIEIEHNKDMSVLAYDPEKRTQIKLYGRGEIFTNGDQVNEAWIQTDAMGRRCYLCEPGSGAVITKPASGLTNDVQSRRPTIEESEEGRNNFAILLITIHQIDWMFLSSKGNRAASFKRSGKDWESNWLIP